MSVLERWRWIGDIAQEVTLEKFVSIFTSLDGVDAQQAALAHAAGQLKRDFEELMLEHMAAWEERWKTAAVRITGDPEAQRWANFAAYHLISAGNAENERVSIGARALSGPIYKGHIFWDSEMFILPFFIFTHPATARAMLMYRYHTLGGARTNAARNGYEGAQYAWESTGDGEEMTPPAALSPTGEVIPILSGHLEHHITADVAYGVWTYWSATRDEEFLLQAGAEILVETARFWASRALLEEDGLYHIRKVEGPDEYHEEIDDNLYTNMMAAYNLRHAVEAAKLLQERHPEEWRRLREKIDLRAEEPDGWSDGGGPHVRQWAWGAWAARAVRGLFRAGGHRRQPLRAAYSRPRYHPGKGADRRLATGQASGRRHGPLPAGGQLYPGDHRRENFLYYDQRTAHGSSLSPSIYGLLAARLGMTRGAMEYLRKAGTIDLGDNMGNAAGGVHAAALGGLWQLLVMGFAGVRAWDAGLFVDPKLPARWRRLEFSLTWRSAWLDFDIRRNRSMTLLVSGVEGLEVEVGIFGRRAAPGADQGPLRLDLVGKGLGGLRGRG